MPKNLLLLLVVNFLMFLNSCEKYESKKSTIQHGFVVSISINNHNNRMAYLHKFMSDRAQIIDSSKITKNTVQFKGFTPYPERYLITIESNQSSKLFITANDSIKIEVSKNDLNNALISGSKLNSELVTYQKNLNRIYKKVDALFPELQRARLENNPTKLLEISEKITSIEKEGEEYSFQYANNNPNSFISAMVLNDLSKKDSVDISRMISIFEQLSDETKKSSDSKELLEYLRNHK